MAYLDGADKDLDLSFVLTLSLHIYILVTVMSTIQIRIDDKTKQSAKKVLDDVGIDMSSAITIYLKQIVINNGIPFKLITANGLTPARERAILKASEEAKRGKNVTRAMNWKEAKRFLDGLK